MIAMLWVNQILVGKKDFSDVPKRLKEQVRRILIDMGYEERIED